MRVAVLGPRGQLGAAVVAEFAGRHEVVALGRDALDVSSDSAVAEVMDRVKPEAIVNCAAYNDVDGAEDQPVRALEVNALAVRAITRAADRCGATLVHYGTDFVFDGTAASPYTEADATNPRSAYAASKLLGEWFAEESPRAYVLRVESLFGHAPGGAEKGTVHAMMTAMRAGKEVRVFEDRTVTPSYVIDVARATRQLLEGRIAAGLYHCVNSGSATWLEFAQEMARLLRLEAKLVRMRLADAKLRAQRPQYCALSNAKLQAAGISMPSWQDALGRYLEKSEFTIRN